MTTLIFDFDGVILDSMPIRAEGFRECLSAFPEEQVDKLILWHEKNGGISRFVKFRYFFEKIRGEKIAETDLEIYYESFSKIMKKLLSEATLQILDCVQYLNKISYNIPCFIASGSEQNELRWLCEQHKLTPHFKGIFGSPSPKSQIISTILESESLDPKEVIMIGDSINDGEAAQANSVPFYAYNNPELREHCDVYIDSFSTCSKLPR